MPGGLTGIQLAQLLITKRPTMKVLLMSGFNQEDAITNLGDFPYRSDLPFEWIELKTDDQARTLAGVSGLHDSRLA